jgi:putative ABC transport system permease protein
MRNLFQDLQYGLRHLYHHPGFGLAAIITLALGIGANSAIFSIFYAVLLRPLPYHEPNRLVALDSKAPPAFAKVFGIDRGSTCPAAFLEWKRRNQVFERMAAFAAISELKDSLINGTEEPLLVSGSKVSEDFFQLLAVEPFLGRNFLPEEHREGKNQVMILSYGFWQLHLGARKDVLGQTLRVNGVPHVIVGVMPPQFNLDYKILELKGVKVKPAFWSPMDMFAEMKNRDNHLLSVIARLKPSVSLERARSDMDVISQQLRQHSSELEEGCSVAVESLDESQRGEHRLPLLILLLSSAVLLSISCVNMANLLSARAVKREKEMAIRSALGAGRGRLLGQLLTESLLLSLLGGGFGLLLASWGIRLVNLFCQDFHFDWPVIQIGGVAYGFTFLLSLITGLAFGFVPALRASQDNLQERLKEGGRSGSLGASKHRLSRLLVVSEVTLALMLSICACLLLKGYWRLIRTNPGFRAENVLTLAVQNAQFQPVSLFSQVLDRISSLPGVQSAALTNNIPTSGGENYWAFQIEGRPQLSYEKSPMLHAQMNFVSPQYFPALSIPLRRGRLLQAQDSATAPATVVINETMARQFWEDQDPVGRRIQLGGVQRTIVGVVGDVRQDTLAKAPEPQAYVSYLQHFQGNLQLVVRTAGDPLFLANAIKAEVRQVYPDLPISSLRTLEKVLAENSASPRLLLSLMGGFAALALLLAVVGIYGVLSHLVGQRSQEIGIRMALGAQRREVLRLVLYHGLKMVLWGELLGIAGGLASARILTSQLFEVAPTDPWTFAAVSLLLLGIALAACYLPARRAAGLDPLVALRFE